MDCIKKLFTVLLIISLLISCFGCNSNGGDNSKNESAPAVSNSDSSVADLSEAEYGKDNLPKKDFEGRDFTILQRTEYKYEFGTDESFSDTVNELIKERNTRVEERFNVKIKTIDLYGNWGVHEDFISYVRNTVNGGDTEYDLIAGYAAIMPSAIADGLFLNWKEIPHVDLKADWWAQDFIDQMTLNDKLYLLTGDISLTFWDSMQGIFFNKKLAENYNLGNLYDKVRNNEWTFDAMNEMCKDTYLHDENLDSRVYSYATAKTTQVDVYQDAFNIPVTEKNAEGKPYFTINQKKTYDALEKVFDLTVDKNYTYLVTDVKDSVKMFGVGRSLFAPLCFSDGSILRTYDMDYGILPMPKYNSLQEKYNSTCCDYYSVFAVPFTRATDAEFIGIITEGLCAESYRSVVPKYYTTILKLRYTKDEDSIEMMDTIREGILCNFGYLYSYTLEWPAHQFNICINEKNTNFASNWAAKEDLFNTNLEKTLDFYFE